MVQTTTTSTDTTASQWQTYNHYQAKRGWECPRCGHINAPWVRQCDCNRDAWTVNWTANKVTVGDMPGWQKEVTRHDDNIMNNPTTYTTINSIDNLQKQLDKLKEIK